MKHTRTNMRHINTIKYILQQQLQKILDDTLVKEGFISYARAVELSHFTFSEENARGIIGFKNYKNKHPKKFKKMDYIATIAHDVMGLHRKEKMFIPRTNSYIKYYNQ